MSAQKSTTPKWVAYIVGWITGLILLATEKQDEDLSWHAANSTAIFGGLTVLEIVMSLLVRIPVLGWLFIVINSLVGLAAFVLWILLMVKAGNGERIRIPFLTDFAEKNLLNLFK